MSKMAEYAYELEFGDIPFDEREMIDPFTSYNSQYNKEIIMKDCEIDNAIKIQEYRELGERLSWNLWLEFYELKWYQRFYARMMVWLNK